MAIRNIAHSIRAGEISLGVAVGVESMSLKSVCGRLLDSARRRRSFLSVLTIFSPQYPPHSCGGGRRQREPPSARLHTGASSRPISSVFRLIATYR
jgi:hypothetical protein